MFYSNNWANNHQELPFFRLAMNSNQEEFKVSVANLLKILQINKKRSKFSVANHQKKQSVCHEQCITNAKPRSDLTDEYLRTFWILVQTNYFKPLQQLQFSCLSYLDQLLDQQPLEKDRQEQYQSFMQCLNATLNSQYLTDSANSNSEIKKSQNWVNSMFLKWKKSIQGSSNSLQLKFNFPDRSNSKSSQRLGKLSQSKSLDHHGHQMETEKELSQSSPSEIDRLIYLAQVERLNIISQTKSILSEICRQIDKETKDTWLFNSRSSQIFIHDKQISSKIPKRLTTVRDTLKYLKYQIKNLEDRQVAESISKLIKAQIHKNAPYFIVTFETALNLPSEHLCEQSFLQINSLRESSLLNFCFTGSKSKFNYTTHNYFGFNAILNNNQTIKSIPRQRIFVELKNNIQNKVQNQCNKLFTELQMCHQCKFLFSTTHLYKCSYSSYFQGNQNMPIAFDAYLEYIFKSEGMNLDLKNHIQATLGRANHFLSYSYQNKSYNCNRYYCRNCLKAYKCGNKSSLCPFCQGICHCSRCIRNDTIFKLASIFNRLGGNIKELKSENLYSRLFKSENRQINSKIQIAVCQSKQSLHRKAFDFTKELQRTRLLCHLVKRRETTKEQLIKMRKDLLKTLLQGRLATSNCQAQKQSTLPQPVH